jgi:Aspartyl protease
VPYFTQQVAPNGNLLLSAFVGVSQARGHALQTAAQLIPNPIPAQGLVDTGASCTCIDPSILTQLKLTPTGSSPVNSPTTGDKPAIADQYDVSIYIPGSSGQSPLIHHTVAVLESKLLAAQGFHLLIGRDILRGCLLTYDGRSGFFILAY